jgi:hypothetical protein
MVCVIGALDVDEASVLLAAAPLSVLVAGASVSVVGSLELSWLTANVAMPSRQAKDHLIVSY